MLDAWRAQGEVPIDGPPWLVALGILATLAGTTSPAWAPAVTRRLRGAGTTETTPEEPVGHRQDATLALVERMISDLQEAAEEMRGELAACTSRQEHLRHERDTALRERDALTIENERLRYRLGEGPTVRTPSRPARWT